jgi:hypothetical protein
MPNIKKAIDTSNPITLGLYQSGLQGLSGLYFLNKSCRKSRGFSNLLVDEIIEEKKIR